MICIIQMDKGSPNINPQPKHWLIAQDVQEAIRRSKQWGDDDVAYWLATTGIDLRPGKYEIGRSPEKGQCFALYS